MTASHWNVTLHVCVFEVGFGAQHVTTLEDVQIQKVYVLPVHIYCKCNAIDVSVDMANKFIEGGLKMSSMYLRYTCRSGQMFPYITSSSHLLRKMFATLGAYLAPTETPFIWL